MLAVEHCIEATAGITYFRSYDMMIMMVIMFQPGQNVGRARQQHHGLSRQHSTSNLGKSNIFFFVLKIRVLVKLPPFLATQTVLYSLERESCCKRIDCICLSSDNVGQWIQDGKFNLKSPLIEFVRERIFPFDVWVVYWLFLLARCRHRRKGCGQPCLVMTG